VLGTDTALRLAIVAGLVIHMAEITAEDWMSKRGAMNGLGVTYAREAFLRLRGLAAVSLPASAPVSLGGGGGILAFDGAGEA